MTLSSALLHFDNLCVHHQDNLLLDHNTGQILAGQRIMLFGQSGSGKSLLLLTLAGLIRHTGNIYLNNTTLGNTKLSNTKKDIWRHQVSLITQTPHLIAGTVLDNLAYPFLLDYHHKRGATFELAWHIDKLDKLGKEPDFLQKDVQVLSGGERQLVNFLRTLQLNPSVLLLDEPTSALDSQSTQKLMALFLAYQHEQSTQGNPLSCLWISHNEDHATLLDAHHWRMSQGKLHTN